ncbi:hypothetical protein [Nitrospirillum iridis]|uniref:Uncharacterized protein n=1 Tax=Nitrospirillum iridis TaxID=765888 RepID=A0A7X0B220_9PROT|nr:hypothetical protein [Nitrospirillum iridis]MBB6253571.1 hypothetical protein [Nitrospirillum iridis]
MRATALAWRAFSVLAIVGMIVVAAYGLVTEAGIAFFLGGREPQVPDKELVLELVFVGIALSALCVLALPIFGLILLAVSQGLAFLVCVQRGLPDSYHPIQLYNTTTYFCFAGIIAVSLMKLTREYAAYRRTRIP